jgi:hypothetical protein
MLTDKTRGLLSYRERKFYYLETGKIVYLGNPIPRLKQTLTMKSLLKLDDMTSGMIQVSEWKEAKLKNVDPEPIYLTEHVRKIQTAAQEQTKPNLWGADD